MNRFGLPDLGTGIGLRAAHFGELNGEASARTGAVSTLFERDEAVPSLDEVRTEAEKARPGGSSPAPAPEPMASELTLGGLQQWLQAVILHPGPTDEALVSPEAAGLVPADRLESAVRPSATLTAAERVGLYHGMYALRMSEALEHDYPALVHFLGAERWAAIVRAYVGDHRSTSYTLSVLGRALPDWLGEAEEIPRRGFCRDLARLERAVAEVSLAEETPRLGEAHLTAVPPQEWGGTRLLPSAAVRLLELRWNAAAWLDSMKDDRHRHPRPRRRESWVVVVRRGYAVGRRELPMPAFRLLRDLVSGMAVGEAVGASLRRRGAPGPEAISRWFRDWASDGLFSRVVGPGASSAPPVASA